MQDQSILEYREVLLDPTWTNLAVGTCQGNLPNHPGGQLALFVTIKAK